MMFTSAVSIAQEKQKITGVVTSQGLPQYGVSVMIEDTNEGVVTEEDGSYTIFAKQGDILRFSYLGLQDVTKIVGTSIFINVIMDEESSVLDEIVILGYGQKKNKNEITGNVVKISGEEISKAPMVSVDQALQGKVAGLQIAGDSGTPGSSQQIRIRGLNSVNASNDPLVVIDGVIVSNNNLSGDGIASSSLSALSTINSNDIESVTVLKDAGATAVYGARGANGVILISTKRGKSGKTKYEFSSSIGFQNNAVKGPRLLSGQEKMDFLLEAYNNSYNGGGTFDSNLVYNQLITSFPGETASLQDWVATGKPNYNWSDLLQNKDALVSILNFSATGGDEKSNFYASLGYNKTEGTIIGTNFRRISGLFTYDRQLSDKLNFGFSANVSNVHQEGILEQAAYFSNPNMVRYFMSPWNPIYNADGSYNITPSRLSGLHNPLYSLSNNIRFNDVIRVLNNNKLSYNIIEDLKFTTQLSNDYTYVFYRNYANPIHGDGRGIGGYADNSSTSYYRYNWQNGFDYRFYIADNHKFDVKVLMEYEKMKYNYLYGYGENIPEGFDMLGNASANYNATSNFEDEMHLSYLGLLNYSYMNKYLLDASIRREGDSKFEPSMRWGTFWSVGLGWNIMNEDFLIDNSTVSTLRLRGSVGTNGNAGIGRNLYQTFLSTDRYDGETALIPSQLGDKVGWEIVKKSDLGINFGFLNDRITGALSYYESKTSEMLFRFPVTRSSGYSSVLKNVGELQNTGFEIELNAKLVQKDNFTWSVFGNLGTVKNKMTKMSVDAQGEPTTITDSYTRIEQGHMVREWYMRTYAGVDPANGDALWYDKDGKTTNVYNDAEVVWQGSSALPTYQGGFGTYVEYNGFFASANFVFSGGNKIYEDWGNYVQGITSTALLNYNSTEYINDRWQQPGDVTNVPKLTFGTNDAHRASTRFLKDGDYIRLRDISFGYDFKRNVLDYLKLSGLTLSIRGTNLYTWVKDKSLKFDPEVGTNAGQAAGGIIDYGHVGFVSPPVKSVIFSVNVKF